MIYLNIILNNMIAQCEGDWVEIWRVPCSSTGGDRTGCSGGQSTAEVPLYKVPNP